jgi:hypothetical protein
MTKRCGGEGRPAADPDQCANSAFCEEGNGRSVESCPRRVLRIPEFGPRLGNLPRPLIGIDHQRRRSWVGLSPAPLRLSGRCRKHALPESRAFQFRRRRRCCNHLTGKFGASVTERRPPCDGLSLFDERPIRLSPKRFFARRDTPHSRGRRETEQHHGPCRCLRNRSTDREIHAKTAADIGAVRVMITGPRRSR